LLGDSCKTAFGRPAAAFASTSSSSAARAIAGRSTAPTRAETRGIDGLSEPPICGIGAPPKAASITVITSALTALGAAVA
jgi:hypothetical protein